MADTPLNVNQHIVADKDKHVQLSDGNWAVRTTNVSSSGSDAGATKTAFGEVNVAQNRPFIQATASYNLIPANFREFTSGTGTTGAENKMFKVTTGTGVGGYGAIQSFRALNYKAGEGGLARFTGVFPNAVADSWQGVGLLNLGDELSFGYNGTEFGIWHRYNGLAEVRTITVTGATGGGGETLALTLNGVQYDIPLTSGTVQHNAYEIANWLEANQSVWSADQVDDTVIISAKSDGAKSGTYTYGGSTSTGTIAQNTAGVTKTSDFVAQTSWNVDTMSTLDPTKGNVFQIEYQYLGFGDIRYSVEDPESGQFKLVHIIKYANNNTTPSLGNPSLKAGMYAVSLGSTTDLSVFVGSFGLFVQGFEGRTRNPRAFENTQTVTTSFTNILTLRNRETYNGYINQVEIEPTLLTVSSESGKNVEVEIRATSDTAVEQNFVAAGTNLVSDVDTSAVTVTNGRLITAFTLAQQSTIAINLQELRIRLPPSLHLVVQAKVTSGANANVSGSLTWYEDL